MSPQNLPVFIKDESCVTPIESVSSEEEHLEVLKIKQFQAERNRNFPSEDANSELYDNADQI